MKEQLFNDTIQKFVDKPKFPTSHLVILIVGTILGGLLINRTDAFFTDHDITFRSPILVQSPVEVSLKELVSPLMVKIVQESTSSASEAATISGQKK